MTEQRTVQLPIVYPGDDVWAELRAIACEVARYGNRVLATQYIARSGMLADVLGELGVEADKKKISRAAENAAYKYANDELSGWVRNAMKRIRCGGYWRRSGRLVVRGTERLACFSADRALSIQADQRHNAGALYEYDADGNPVLLCRFRPARTHEPIRLVIALESTRARKDDYLREAVENIWSGRWVPGTISFRFDRRRRKLAALVSYSLPVAAPREGGRAGVVGPLAEGAGGVRMLMLRMDAPDGPVVADYSDRLRLLAEKKEHFADIVARLRRGAGRKGRSGRYRAYRRKLAELGSFDEWAHGKLHEWTAHVVAKLEEHDITKVDVLGIDDGEWPAAKFRQMLAYKCADARIAYEEDAETTPAYVRARMRENRKKAQHVRRAKAGIGAVREALTVVGAA